MPSVNTSFADNVTALHASQANGFAHVEFVRVEVK